MLRQPRAISFSKHPLSLAREARSALRPRSGAREGEGEGRFPPSQAPHPALSPTGAREIRELSGSATAERT